MMHRPRVLVGMLGALGLGFGLVLLQRAERPEPERPRSAAPAPPPEASSQAPEPDAPLVAANELRDLVDRAAGASSPPNRDPVHGPEPLLIDLTSGRPVPHARIGLRTADSERRVMTDCEGRLPVSREELAAVQGFYADHPQLAAALETAALGNGRIEVELPPFLHVHLDEPKSLHGSFLRPKLSREGVPEVPLTIAGFHRDVALLFAPEELRAEGKTWNGTLEVADHFDEWFATAPVRAFAHQVDAIVRDPARLLVKVEVTPSPTISDQFTVEVVERNVPRPFYREGASLPTVREVPLPSRRQRMGQSVDRLDAGEYLVRLNHPGFHPAEQTVRLAWGDSGTVAFSPSPRIPSTTTARVLLTEPAHRDLEFSMSLEVQPEPGAAFEPCAIPMELRKLFQQRPRGREAVDPDSLVRGDWELHHLGPALHRITIVPADWSPILAEPGAIAFTHEFYPPAEIVWRFDPSDLDSIVFTLAPELEPLELILQINIGPDYGTVASKPLGASDRSLAQGIEAPDTPTPFRFWVKDSDRLGWSLSGLKNIDWGHGRLSEARPQAWPEGLEPTVHIAPPEGFELSAEHLPDYLLEAFDLSDERRTLPLLEFDR